jgi:Domain of unknown function (DUF4115)
VPLLDDLSTKIVPAEGSVVDAMAQPRDYSPVRAAAREQASRRFVVLGAVLLLIVLGALGWYATRQQAQTVATATVPAPAAVVPPVTTASPSIAPVAEPAAVASATPAAAASPGDGAAVMEPVAPPPLLKLRFIGPSWAEVKDAEGKVLHSQHNVAGADFVIEGTPPFYVVIGDTTKATVEVRGENYDMVPHTRQNVARFTIN